MRLLIEGAVNLYEGDAMPLSRLAIDYGTLSAANAFDAIGTALYSLLDHIRSGRIDPSFVVTHRIPLEHIAEGYHMFSSKLDDCVKTVVVPSEG